MFDIGFFELMVVAVIGLLVIGPERLPETIRTISLWIGRLRRSLRETRAELEEHIGADDIRRQLHNEEIMRSLESTRQAVDRTLNETVSLDAGTSGPGNGPELSENSPEPPENSPEPAKNSPEPPENNPEPPNGSHTPAGIAIADRETPATKPPAEKT